jgi:hypothetical protein
MALSISRNTWEERYIRRLGMWEKASLVRWAWKLSLICKNFSCSRMTIVIQWSEPGNLSRSPAVICSMQAANCR